MNSNQLNQLMPLIVMLIGKYGNNLTPDQQSQLAQDVSQVLTQISLKPSLLHNCRDILEGVCVAVFAAFYLVFPCISFISTLLGHQPPPIPNMDMTSVLALLGALLGTGALKSLDKAQK